MGCEAGVIAIGCEAAGVVGVAMAGAEEGVVAILEVADSGVVAKVGRQAFGVVAMARVVGGVSISKVASGVAVIGCEAGGAWAGAV